MPLTLSVVNADAMSQSLSVRQKVFTRKGGTLGRSQEDDWILPDPQRYVSNHHAIIKYNNGEYFLIDTSTNGVYHNDSGSAIGRDHSVALREGDRIYIGEYEISVSIQPETSTQNMDTVQGDMGGIPNDLDPLALFDVDNDSVPQHTGRSQTASVTDRKDVMDPTPSLDEFFSAPDIEAEMLIPDDWALTQTGISMQQTEGDRAHWEDELQPVSKVRSAPVDKRSSGTRRPKSPAQHRSRTNPKQFYDRDSPANNRANSHVNNHINNNVQAQRPRPGGSVEKRRSQRTDHVVPQSTPTFGGEYEKLLHTIGIDEKSIPPELANVFPEILGLFVRECVSGLMEVLVARTSMKSAFRVDQTTIQPAENNPLKFSVSVDEALENMFLKNERGYLPALDAIRESFGDIKSHQMAMLVGMQGALQDVLGRFDPQGLEDQISLGSKGSLLMSVYNKSKYWDAYKALYKDINREALDNFQNLLGDGFMRAYEEQINRMTQANPGSKNRDDIDNN